MEKIQENIPAETPGIVSNEEIKKILTENQQLLAAIYEQTQKTKKYIRAGRIMSFIYLLLIVAPLLFAIFYLPPLLKNYMAPYQELLGQTQGVEGLNVDAVNNLLKQFQQ